MDKFLQTNNALDEAQKTQELYKKRLDILIPIFEFA
jgi:hypothetical protein